MDVIKLWEKLNQPNHIENTFIKDIKEGKVPELPFFIVDQVDLKAAIKTKIENIDSDRMTTNIVSANYGNGKTNVLKYLELFYNKTYTEHKIKVLYSRADAERTDLVVFLLKQIQDNYLDQIINIIKRLKSENFDYKVLVNEYSESFAEIREYTIKLFAVENDEDLKNLIYLGTGRLSNKRYFDKFDLEQLKDFNRREILVLLLNILSQDAHYIIFAIDEVEKIIEKSKTRFNHFLTSYRELVDLFNKINGHYLILAITDGSDSNHIETANEALFTRIKGDIVGINPITSSEDKTELIEYLKDIFKKEVQTEDILFQLKKVNEEDTRSNRLLIQTISRLIFKKETVALTLETLLKEYALVAPYNKTKEDLEINDAFKNIHRKFFDPLEYYLESFGYNRENIKKQERYFIDIDSNRLQYFIFNDNKDIMDNEFIKIRNLEVALQPSSLIVYSPVTLELNNSAFHNFNAEIRIVDYKPEELFILLELYRDNFDLQPSLKDLISNYTKENL